MVASKTGGPEVHAIPLGAKGAFTLLVTPEHLANRLKDSILPPVLATPLMILAMENAALNAIRSYLEPGESAVGTAVDIRHIAATPAGQRVTAEAEVTLVEDRRIVFAVTARDELEEIGRGTHERMVVDLRRIAKRLDAKKQAAIEGRERRPDFVRPSLLHRAADAVPAFRAGPKNGERR
jgi:fluoroacetyl-CoA thioesterase